MRKKAASAALCLALIMTLPLPARALSYVMTYGFAGTSTIYKNNISKTDGVLNTFSPSCFDLNADGSMTLHSLNTELIEYLHSQDISVTPFLSNHWDKPSGNAALDNIEAVTDALASAVKAYNLDGVNVDIQNVNETYRDKYTLFVKTLREKLPDKTVTVAVAANPYGWTLGWHGSYDYAALAANSDYLMIMAYDESYYASDPGPVASAVFVEKSITYALKYTTPDKIVLGVPFYGRYWKSGASVGGYAITARDVEGLLADYPSAIKTYDAGSQSAKVTVTLDSSVTLWGGGTLSAGTYTIWYDDIEALLYKIGLINEYGLKGLGSWALGQEDTAIWALCRDTLDNLVFTDINGHWAEDYVMSGYEKGWLLGSEGRFRPNDSISRAEIAVILVRVCNLQDGIEGADFSDTAAHWAADEIAIARNYGLVQGMGNDLYEPDMPMSREQMAVLLERVVVLSNGVDFTENPFTDLDKDTRDWSYDAIIKLYGNGVLEGYEDGSFRPAADVSRAEVAAILERISGYGVSAGTAIRRMTAENSADGIVSPR